MDSKTANIVDVIKRIEYAEKKFCGCGYSHGKYVINKKTGLVDVPFGSVCMNFMTLYDLDDETIPIPFGVVKKNFEFKGKEILFSNDILEVEYGISTSRFFDYESFEKWFNKEVMERNKGD